MYLPEWILPYKEPRTEIRCIRGIYYKYEVEYKYNKDKKRTDKKTIRLLGKITEKEGFVPSDKDLIRRKAAELPKVDIKNFGVYNLFSDLLKSEIESLRDVFKEEIAQRLLSFSMMRWAHQSSIKRATNYHIHDYCSEVWSSHGISDKYISETLKFVGQNRETLVEWMRKMLGTLPPEASKFVMMDSTHVSTVSEKLNINAKGYNPSHDYDEQIRLMYLFSSQMKQPVYYRLINGNITDIKSMSICLKEMNINDVIFIADKGFFSRENTNQMDLNKMQYIIPVRRNNQLIDFEPILNGSLKKDINNYFIYQERAIWFYQYQKDGYQIVTFLDEKLKVEEETDYLTRIKSHPEEYTEAKFQQRMHGFGTITIVYKLNNQDTITAQEVYQAYKERNEIEIMFDGYKNFLQADKMYMQDRHVLEGWLMANFVAMIAYYKLQIRIKQASLSGKYSPKDIIEICKSIYKIRINGQWYCSEITAKNKKIFKQIGIDNLI